MLSLINRAILRISLAISISKFALSTRDGPNKRGFSTKYYTCVTCLRFRLNVFAIVQICCEVRSKCARREKFVSGKLRGFRIVCLSSPVAINLYDDLVVGFSDMSIIDYIWIRRVFLMAKVEFYKVYIILCFQNGGIDFHEKIFKN